MKAITESDKEFSLISKESEVGSVRSKWNLLKLTFKQISYK